MRILQPLFLYFNARIYAAPHRPISLRKDKHWPLRRAPAENKKKESPDHQDFPFFGGDEGIRTLDLSDANRTLSQLSYRPIKVAQKRAYTVF